jgi:hypothetical protein
MKKSPWRYKKGDRAILLIEVEVLAAHGMDDGWKAYRVLLQPPCCTRDKPHKFDVHQEDLFTEQGLIEAIERRLER